MGGTPPTALSLYIRRTYILCLCKARARARPHTHSRQLNYYVRRGKGRIGKGIEAPELKLGSNSLMGEWTGINTYTLRIV